MRFVFARTCLALMAILGVACAECTDSGIDKKLESIKNTMSAMARQMMLQQLFIEERIRSEAQSGVKQVRHNREGTRNYYSNTHSGLGSVLAIHDHSNNDRTVGMGEFVGVLNGVEFRTRHNDYRLYMPHRTSANYHSVENIPFPDVPPEVTSKANVSEQVKEMREWFKAFHNQDHSIRDYRKYFKPVLCYLEGAWTKSTSGAIDEGFDSDRHFIDAKSWHDLQEKIRFTSYSGRKDNLENFSFLPTTIMGVSNNGTPEFAQWNYRILCNPISRDIPLNRLRMVDELGPRVAQRRTYDEQTRTRSARFQLNPLDTDKFYERETRRWALLDEIMSEIPGKDNYQGNLTDDAFDLMAYSLEPGSSEKLRADRYHRWFKVAKRGAMGLSARHRGYSDENLFMAMTTQSKVAGMELEVCKGRGKKRVCKKQKQKWTYAIPLEIIFLTPLSKWNPYNIDYKGDPKYALGKTVEAGGRNGGKTLAKAFNGTHSRAFYMTPTEFFSGEEVGTGAADTTKGAVGVLDRSGTKVHFTRASGTRIFFPPILGVGSIRQRYPIMPVHGEGSSVWKELEALKDVVLKSKSNGFVLREPLNNGPIPTEGPRKDQRFQVGRARKNPPGPHTHEIKLTPEEMDFIKAGGSFQFTTTQGAGHTHDMFIRWVTSKRMFIIDTCDDNGPVNNYVCRDKHTRWLTPMPDM
ncbi:uncharacterized protein LOC116604390 [Nematostella vectensis]|uniref:uncharacterized protein LOC116604390 n=1 Tax=Nematostella vectensis TaxID=45351 RepID=UPI0020770B0F|nr:uncharacterized protein LOC116604390 [Nematostella vectensis]